MANQMIALGVKGPQTPNLMAAMQQYGGMMNQIAQQKAAARQAEQAQAEMAAAQRKEQRDIKAADIDLAGKQIDYHYRRATAVRNAQGYAAWLAGVEQDSPEFAEFFRTNLPPEQFDPAALIQMVAGVKDNFDARFPRATSEAIIGEGGDVGVLSTNAFSAPTLVRPRTYQPGATPGGQVELGEQTTVDGQGGPMIPASNAPTMPGVAPSRMSTDMAGLLTNARNDAEYQQALGLIGRMNPQAAQALRQIMPTYDAQLMDTVRTEAQAAFGGQGAPAPAAGDFPLVAGPRGGPPEGYVEAPTPFRARVPAPPSQPQPRETAEEVYAKELAREQAKSDAAAKAPPPKPVPLTEAQRLARRDALAGNYKKAQGLLDKTYGKAGIIDTVNDVRNLSRDQKEAITGYSAYAPSVFASSKDADRVVKNLKDTVTELGKDAASASGAIGPMAVQEWKIVAGMIANLELEGMTAEGLDEQLNRIEAKAKNAARLTQQAFDAQYGADVKSMPEFRLKTPGGAKSAPKPGSQYPVMTPEQVRKAPKGTKFRRADNGQPMVKQ